ncbi:hypothetical protein HYU22_02205 [Candidatus Woesearchaeota archaeon]|nr:hypothetical protein [Candidatus Woesearchaeota archaeon]
MLQPLKDYAKWALRNKVVAGSYAGIFLSVLIDYIVRERGVEIPRVKGMSIVDGLLLYPSGFMLGFTLFGMGTYESYRKMRDHIADYGTIDSRFQKKFSSLYCTQVGIRMAAEEAGLERLL